MPDRLFRADSNRASASVGRVCRPVSGPHWEAIIKAQRRIGAAYVTESYSLLRQHGMPERAYVSRQVRAGFRSGIADAKVDLFDAEPGGESQKHGVGHRVTVFEAGDNRPIDRRGLPEGGLRHLALQAELVD